MSDKPGKWIEWNSCAPKGEIIEVKFEDEFPVLAYYGGGADKAWREVTSCRQIMTPLAYRTSKTTQE